jgi:NAD-dependent deacetylase
MQDRAIARAAQLFRDSSSAVALTGAGISTPSGIPDFRSAGSGLWERHDPMQVASLLSFRHQPENFFDWFRELAVQLWKAQPNPAHEALARLEHQGFLQGVITQNIDGLHHKAGSAIVIEVHGNLRNSTCISCYRSYPSQDHFDRYVRDGEYPICQACGSYLKPDVILFGEQLPHEIYRQAEQLAGEADLMLIGGSSLEVAPVSTLPLMAANHGAKLIIMNRDATYLDERAEVIVHADVADVLPALADEILDGS